MPINYTKAGTPIGESFRRWKSILIVDPPVGKPSLHLRQEDVFPVTGKDIREDVQELVIELDKANITSHAQLLIKLNAVIDEIRNLNP